MKDTAELRHLLEWQEQRWGHEHPKVIATLEALADLLQMQGKCVEAEPLYWQILEKKHKQFGANDLRVADTIYDLACLHEKQENWAECERLYKWTCDIRCRLLPEGDAQLDDSVAKAKEIALKQGHEISLTTFQTQVSVPELVKPKFDWKSYLEHCKITIMKRDYDFAGRILSCLADVADAYEPASKMQADVLHLLGRVRFHQRDLQDSLRSFEQALAIYEKVTGTASAETATCLEDMADVHCKLAEAAEAQFLFDWARQIHEALPGNEQHTSRLRLKLESLDELCSTAFDQNSDEYKEENPEITEQNSAANAAVDAAVNAAANAAANVAANAAANAAAHAAANAEQNADPSEHQQSTRSILEQADMTVPRSQEDQVAHFLWTRWIDAGKAALDKEDLVGAEMMIARGLDKANEFGYQDTRLWRTLCDMSDLHLRQSKFVKAILMLNTAQQYCEKTLGPMHPQNAYYWEKLGRMYENQGENKNAVMCFDKLVTILVKANRPLIEYGIFLKKLERLHEKAPASFFD